ncbi:hypothetical protein B0H66DRAFT_526984 [Apodospora peruviana]|uniref:PhoD-like phosphatase domain-containing protein n=1 Tax=Apodospora peruviana TaxID=516989 RepID=A0AAE0IS88_9PEZI|nr:hypothetical protein B0H66DRAFT_526984 [Apodospora peruviana]
MSAPYWGQLPPPKAGQTKARRLSDDLTPQADRRQSLDVPSQGQPRSNRVSVQTTKSDAPTDSTLSPFVSPTASSFPDQGLAPRPPSLPYGANQYQPPELIENRRRRRSRNQEQDYEYAAAAGPPPPAAPEVPRAPPVSYKYQTGNGGPPYSYAAPPQGPPRPAKEMAPEEYYKAPTPVNQRENLPVLDRARNTLDPGGSPRAQRNSTDPTLARNSSVRDEVNGHRRRASGADQNLHRSRRTSLNQPTDRSKMFADDRSPLQRLELTLDSISKEDKRARVEAAERAAREKTSGNEAGQQAEKSPAGQQVRFQERRPSAVGEDESKAQPQLLTAGTPVTPTRPAHSAAASMGPLSQNPPEEGRKYGSGTGRSPGSQAPESKIPVPVSTLAAGIPQRNLSFRERAARNDIKPPNGVNVSTPQDEVTTPTNGTSLTRSGSNKLKKNPPGDPWYSKRKELEEKYPTIEIRNGPRPATKARETGGTAGPESHAPGFGAGPVRANAHAPEPAYQHRSGFLDVDDYYEDDMVTTPPTAAKLTKSPSQRKADQLLGRSPPQHLVSSATRRSPPTVRRSPPPVAATAAATSVGGAVAARGFGTIPSAVHHHPARRDARSDSDSDEEREDNLHHVSNLIYHARDKFEPGRGLYQPTPYLDEWKKATVGTLSGALLDLEDIPPEVEKSTPWWESPGSKRRGSMASRPKKAEAFEGEYDDTNAPTRFKPPLHLKCGPLLRYCGIRNERVPSRSARNGAVVDKEIWRGSVMIVTTDADSSYDIAPTLRLFVQPLELLPPPPREISGDEPLAPEYVDPIAGHPKLGRKGETLYVRPVDHLDENKDLSRDETDDGLFEKSRSPPDVPLADGATDPPGSFAARRKRAEMDGEKAGKYKDVRGFRLHKERGFTFWRFNIEVELRGKQQRVAYRINRGPSTGFWVPAKGQAMNIMFHSCNGFSMSVDADEFSGPDPMWRDVLNTHQSQPFHVMLGGGDQIYNDRCMQDTKLFKAWLMIKNPLHKHNAPFTPQMQDELEFFYLHRYAMWFSQGLFGMANSQIPMVNMFDDHDIIDGFGSYPHHFMNSPVFSGLGNVAFKYYMLFQHQSVVDETEVSEPSWTLGAQPGPYINELSRSLFMMLGSKVALLAVDARTERKRDEVVSKETWEIIMNRCYKELEKGKVEHLLVLLGVPIAYPRLVWLENILTSRLMDPIKALGKVGLLGGFLNRFDGGVEVLDDLDDHWTAKNHKHERSIVIEDLQDLAAGKSIRVSILSGDVHLAAIGQFFSNQKLGVPKHKDFRYIPNVISSAIVNTPPPDLMADILNKRNKVHHFDKETDENMIPIFGHGVDGKPRNNKCLLPHRNWCSIREYVPGNTPPPTPDQSEYDLTPLGTPPGTASYGGGAGGLLRRLSKSRPRGPSFRGPDSVRDRTRPPLSGGLLRTLSRQRVSASADEVGNAQSQQTRPGFLTRTLSGSSVNGRFGGLFRRRGSNAGPPPPRHDDGGINGNWGPETEDEDDDYDEEIPRQQRRGIGLRGGLGDYPHDYEDEYADGDESHFSVKQPPMPPQQQYQEPPPRSRAPSTTTTAIRSNTNKQLPPEPAPVPMPVMSGGATPRHNNNNSSATAGPVVGMSRPASAGLKGAGDVAPEQEFIPKQFHRVPTGLSVKQLKKRDPAELAVNLSGGLEVCLNVEISQKDPGGSTVPYRLIVPRLWYDEELEEDNLEFVPPNGEKYGHQHQNEQESGAGGGRVGGLKRLISLRRA